MSDAATKPEKVIVREVLVRYVLEQREDGDFYSIGSRTVFENEWVQDRDKALRGVGVDA